MRFLVGEEGQATEDTSETVAVLDAKGFESKFVKLSQIDVRPCRACKRCVKDNTCKVGDDFPAMAEKIKRARVLVVGAYYAYGFIDGFTKSFLKKTLVTQARQKFSPRQNSSHSRRGHKISNSGHGQ
jgi:multimeric flavodoxin WrbA